MDVKKEDKSKSFHQEIHVVTGGGGYVGQRLGLKLAEQGYHVRLFDLKPPKNLKTLPNNVEFCEGNLLDENLLQRALADSHCVYHVASYGMSGREMLNRHLIRRVNVEGTRLLIKLCKSLNIERLVYTSTYNVVFGGQEILNGNEKFPYWPLEKHTDEYSKTKCIAEKMVLESKSPDFKTCALRLAAIYGPGEERHFPRIINYLEKGLFKFTYGKAIVDFVHVDNVVDCHILAAQKLKEGKSNGEAYFVSDGAPIKNWDFMKVFVEGLGYSYPRLKLPVHAIFFLAFIIEIIHKCFSGIYNFQPMLTRAEVYKTGVTHYFCIDKVSKDLNYKPFYKNDVVSLVKWFRSNGYYKKLSKRSYYYYYYILGLLIIMIALCLIPVVY